MSTRNGGKSANPPPWSPSRKFVVHISSVHDASDTRIYHRECRALSEAGYRVALLTADSRIGHTPKRLAYAEAHPVSVPSLRGARAVVGAWRMRKEALASAASLYHIHDPELLMMVPGLRKRGARVVYDAHEDLAAQILEKGWIPRRLRVSISRAVSRLLPRVTSRLDAVVAATPDIAELHRAPSVRVVRNFPVLSELIPSPDAVPYRERPPRVAYVGAITALRGATHMVAATKLLLGDLPSVELALAGEFTPETLKQDLLAKLGPANLSVRGQLDREGVRDLLGSARIGLVVTLPTSAYLRSLPVKMFEYMAAGIPIIASDFPMWRDIIESAGCGLLVNPSDPEAIAEALRTLLSDLETAEYMGLRGQEAASRRFSWSSEAQTLIDLYGELLLEASS